MAFWNKKNKADNTTTATPEPVVVIEQSPASSGDPVSLVKGKSISLVKTSNGVYTLITQWGAKDYDLYALVEYVDGHVEVVSCFGTTAHPERFSLSTKDGAVVHVSGDKAAYNQDLPQEVMTVRLNPQIKCVVVIVYSAKNSGAGSFHEYRVGTYAIPGNHQVVPNDSTDMVRVDAIDANRHPNVYTFVPAVIDNSDPSDPKLTAVELYSRPHSELRPTVRNCVVTMDSGEENALKPAPH